MRNSYLLASTLLATTFASPAFAEAAPGADDGAPQAAAARDASGQPAAKPAGKAFSTGVAKGRDLLDTAISASVIDETDLPKLSVTSVGGIIQFIPGLRVETSDMDGYASITVRGLPLAADGSKFLQLQEDGLPVLEFGDVRFAPADQFIRADLSLSQVQAIRGGSASTFASNSPGGVVNFISKTGETEGGTVQLSSGLGYDLKRVDYAYGSPLGNGWRFHVGGFYREGEGPRHAGYTAFRGGQVKLNVTKEFAGGYIRFYGKYLDDRQPDYANYPVLLSGTNDKVVVSDLPGNSIKSDILNSPDTSRYPGVDADNARTSYNFQHGHQGISKSVGVEAQVDLAGWTVSNRFRFSDVSGETNQSLPFISAPAAALGALLGGPGATFTYAAGPDVGKPFSPASLAALSIKVHGTLNSLDNVTNDARASRVWPVGGGKLTTTAGLYVASQSVDTYWSLLNVFNDLSGGGRNLPLNLTSAGGIPLTENGLYAYGMSVAVPLAYYHNRYDLTYRVTAPYGSVNYQIGKLAIGGSLRWDKGKVRGQIYSASLQGNGSASLDVNGDGTISVPETKVAILPLSQPAQVGYDYDYLSYSVGVNYRFAPSLSGFARYSRGGRANTERNLGAGALNPVTGQLVDPSAAYSPVKQAEGGIKFRQGGVTAYVTAFWASTIERNSQIGADSKGQPTVIPINRTYTAKGVEFEGEVRKGPFALAVGATLTDARIDKDVANPAIVGNRPRQIPTFSFQARPQVELKRVTFGAAINGITESFAQDSNILKQPGYVLVSPFLQVRPTERLQLSVNAFNVFDKLAIVQIASSIIPAGGITNAQVMNGRTVTGSIRFTF